MQLERSGNPDGLVQPMRNFVPPIDQHAKVPSDAFVVFVEKLSKLLGPIRVEAPDRRQESLSGGVCAPAEVRCSERFHWSTGALVHEGARDTHYRLLDESATAHDKETSEQRPYLLLEVRLG